MPDSFVKGSVMRGDGVDFTSVSPEARPATRAEERELNKLAGRIENRAVEILNEGCPNCGDRTGCVELSGVGVNADGLPAAQWHCYLCRKYGEIAFTL